MAALRCHSACSLLRRGRSVVISASRLDEFMQAELRVFAAKRPTQPLRFLDVVGTSSSPAQLAQLVHEELPARFARRVKHIERVEGWDTIPELVDLHDMHIQSFRELRLANPLDADHYPEAISRIRQRHKNIASLFAEAVKSIDRALIGEPEAELGADQEEASCLLDRHAVEVWAETFLRSRVSTEMLMSHYETCTLTSHNQSDSRDDPTKVGIIDMQCDPWRICQQAIAQIQDGPWPCLIEAENVSGQIKFCHVPRYLFYMIDELLKNSARASADAVQDHTQGLKPIRMSMCADESQVVIRISDRGGGMPSKRANEMWSYTFTTSTAMPGASRQSPEVQRPWGVFAGQNPISGRGVGLPLCRLYAMYLGGSLQIMNMPGLGVDAYLFLNRMDPRGGGVE